MKNNICIALVLWSFLGLLLGMDYTSYHFAAGIDIIKLKINLISTENPIFMYQLFFFLLSTILVAASYFSTGNYVKLWSGLEILIWLSKLLILKDGYVMGFGGTFDEEILLYDFVGVFVRVTLLNSYFWGGKKTIFAFLLAFIIIYIKVGYFAFPFYYLPI